MRDDEFKQKLTEVCEWEIPKTIKDTANTSRRRIRCEDTVTIGVNEEIVFTEWNNVNPTYGPKITKIKPQPTTCEDCGRICDHGRHTEAKLVQRDDRKAWRKKCVTCGRFQNPFTGQFTLTGSMASAKWNDFLRDVKGTYDSKGQQQRQQLIMAKKNHDLDTQ